MTLLNDPASKRKSLTPVEQREFADVQAQQVNVIRWPAHRHPQGIGVSVKDGWFFGIGFGLALTLALPIILFIFGCALWFIISILGVSLGAMLQP